MTSLPSKGRILICDDEDGIRDILARLVRSEGYEVVEAADGIAALAAIHHKSPDAVFLDIRMPGLDGIEVLRRVRQQAPNLPVVMITTCLSVTEGSAALHGGANGYLLKPFRHEDVIQSLRQALGVRHLRHGAVR